MHIWRSIGNWKVLLCVLGEILAFVVVVFFFWKFLLCMHTWWSIGKCYLKIHACTHGEVLASEFLLCMHTYWSIGKWFLKIHACTHGEVLAPVTFRNFCYACTYRKVLGIGLLFSKFLVCVHVHIDKFWHLLIWEILLCINVQIEHCYVGKLHCACIHTWRGICYMENSALHANMHGEMNDGNQNLRE